MSEPLASMKAQVYKDPRPADLVYEAVRALTSLYAWTFFRARCIGSENVPPAGPVILAPNHFSFMDHFFVGAFTRRKVRFMAKSQLFKPPIQWIYTHGGVFPVRRGHRDEEAFITAGTVLDREGCIAMYCEGGRSRTGTLSERARPGIGRLALETGAPVVPVAIHGSQRVRNWKKLQFPRVTIQYGAAIRYEPEATPSKELQQAVADDIFARIGTLYAGLEQHGRRGIAQAVREQRRAARRAAKPATS
jgi:1-acyl-sn-glycerol-3-phosphate acyltransferase